MGPRKIVMKRALRGFYAGKHIKFGNQISEDGGNKTRRSWKPNRQHKRLFSLGIDKYIRLDITTHALRLMDRMGGLDEYIINLPKKEFHVPRLQFLRKWVMDSYKIQDGARVPPDLAEKIKKMITWNFIDRRKQEAEEAAKKAEEEAKKSQEVLKEIGGPLPEESIDDMFAKFSIDKEEHERMPRGRRLGKRAQLALRPSGSSPTPKREEFPENLFSG